jgi:hypothetical protein
MIAALSEEIAGYNHDVEAWAQKWPAAQRLRQIRTNTSADRAPPKTPQY